MSLFGDTYPPGTYIGKLSEPQILIIEMIHVRSGLVTGIFYGHDLDIKVEQKSNSTTYSVMASA